jgi:gluconolactonase
LFYVGRTFDYIYHNYVFIFPCNSNFISRSNDNSLMYYIDTLTLNVEVFDFDDATGSLSNRRNLFSFEKNRVEGFPDGMTIDVNGHLWIACFGGGRVKT